MGTFGLTGGLEALEGALQALDTVVLGEYSLEAVRGGPTWEAQIQDNVELHKATMKYCNADPCKVSIVVAGEEHTVAGSPIHEATNTKPLKARNINTTVPPKRVMSETFWDEGTIGKMTELNMEYPGKCSETTQVMGNLGGTHITLNSDARPEEQRPYHTKREREEIGNTLIVPVPQVRPTTTKLLCEILGHMGYYRKSSRRYALITELVRTLLKHDISFSWDGMRQKSFKQLRNRMVAAPIFASPAPAMIVHTVTSGIAREVGST